MVLCVRRKNAYLLLLLLLSACPTSGRVAIMNAKFPGSAILGILFFQSHFLHVRVDSVHPSSLWSSSLPLSLNLHPKHLSSHISFISPFHMSKPPQPAFSCLYRECLYTRHTPNLLISHSVFPCPP